MVEGVIKQKSKVVMRDGGNNIRVPLMVGKNNTTNSYEFYDVLDNTPQKGMIDAKVDWARYATAITISEQEMDETGPAHVKMVDLMKGKIMQAEESLKDRLSTDLYLDGTGNDSKNLLGLLAMIPTSSTSSTYMSVDGTSVTAWTQKYQGGASTTLEAMLGNLYRSLKDGGVKPNIILTSDGGEKLYEDLQTGTAGVSIAYRDAEVGDIGFGSLRYKGIPMITDKHHPDYNQQYHRRPSYKDCH